ncbi:MAG: VanZ family protein [Cytophagales bacterium]|nr:VanZ family protein [Cytophagales bacterium]
MRYTIGLITWVLLMSYGIFKPGNPNAESYWFFPGDDKLIHLGLFCGLTSLFILAMTFDWKLQTSRAIRIAIITGLIFASITEPIQYYVPFRSSDWYDFLFNVIGVFTGLGAFQLIFNRK